MVFRKIGILMLSLALALALGGTAFADTQIDKCTTISAPGTYILNTSILNTGASPCIDIISGNVVLDGAGYMIDGIGSNAYGVRIYKSGSVLTNVTVKNLTVTDFSYGIYYRNSVLGKILNNNVTSNYFGIYLDTSSENTLAENTLQANKNYGFYLYYSNFNNLTYNFVNSTNLYGLSIQSSRNNNISSNIINNSINGGFYFVSEDTYYNTVKDNRVNGDIYYHLLNESNIELKSMDLKAARVSNTGKISIINSTNITLSNLNLTNNTGGSGLFLYKSKNSSISNVYARSNSNGIYIEQSRNNTLNRNNASSNTYGIYIYGSYNSPARDNNNLTDNIANSNSYGIRLSYSNFNNLTNNTANSNSNGIYIDSSNNNTLAYNTGNSNSYGISLYTANNHTITGNKENLNSYGLYLSNSRNSNISSNSINYSTTNGLYFGDAVSYYNTIENNRVNGEIYYHFVYANNTVIKNLDLRASRVSNIGKISVISSTNVTLMNLTLVNNAGGSGLFLYQLKNSNISSVSAYSNSNGVYIEQSQNNTLNRNNASSNTNYGFYFNTNKDNKLINNIANSNSYGIYLYYSNSHNLTNNTANSSSYGIYLGQSNNNTLRRNNANMNSYGLYISYSRDNNISNNNINYSTTNGLYFVDAISYYNIMKDNRVNGDIYYHLLNESNIELKGVDLKAARVSNTGKISVINSINITLRNLNLTNNTGGSGLFLFESKNSTIKNVSASSNRYGIYTEQSRNNTYNRNNASSNTYGIYLVGSYYSPGSFNTFTDNTASLNNYGFYLSSYSYYNDLILNNASQNTNTGFYINSGANNNLSGNTANSNSNYGFYIYASNINLTRNIANSNNYGIYLQSNGYNNLTGNNASHNNYGIYLQSSNYNNLTGNNANLNAYGIDLYYTRNNNLTGNTASSNSQHGIYLEYTDTYNNLTANTANSNSNGIYLRSSSNYNNLTGNIVNLNSNGIYLQSSGTNNLTGNSAELNIVGINLDASSNNILYLNNLVNNTNYNAYDTGTNIWDNGSIGNHFSNFDEPGEGCNDIDSNGICDASYSIPGGTDIDRYPLVSWGIAPDIIPPASITNLRNISYAPNYINWTWTDPADPDFAKVMVYINGNFKTNVTKGTRYYKAINLAQNTSYRISTHTVDTSGNINMTWRNHTARTAKDITPPASITNLKNISYAPNYINWTWADPRDADFAKVMVYINGTFKKNVTKGVRYYNATNLTSNTSYKISTHTVDTSGNFNETWINHTARTAKII